MKPSESIFRSLELPINGLNLRQIKRNKLLAEQHPMHHSVVQSIECPVADRTYENIMIIYDHMLTYRHFMNIKQKYGQVVLFRLAQHVKLVRHPISYILQHKNTEITMCYVIIEGQIAGSSIEPRMKQSKQLQVTQYEIYNVGDEILEQHAIKDDISTLAYYAISDVLLFGFDKYIFKSVLLKSKPYKVSDKMFQLFTQFEWLNVLGEYDKLELLNSMKIKKYALKQIVYAHGSVVDCLYFAKQGTFRVVQKIGDKKFNNSIQDVDASLINFIKPNLISKEQFQTVSKITVNEVFGFEEHLLTEQFHKYSVYSQSDDAVLYQINIDVFFEKFNQVFNTAQFNLLVEAAKFRDVSRKRINTVQRERFDLITTKQETVSKSIDWDYQPFETDNTGYLSSQVKPQLLRHTILLPEEMEYMQGIAKKQKCNDYSLGFQDMSTHVEDETEKKRVKARINHQLQKMLITNKQFRVKQKVENDNLQDKLIQFRNKRINLASLKSSCKRILNKTVFIQNAISYEESRDLQNSHRETINKLSSFLPNVKVRKIPKRAKTTDKIQQKLIIL